MHPIEQKQTGTFNDIGISRQLDWPRIRKLLTIGLFGGGAALCRGPAPGLGRGR